MPSIAENIQRLRDRVRELEDRYQRESGSVKLLAVSKTHPVENILQAMSAGQKDFGENYLQEALDKIQAIGRTEVTWHFIGPIQSNKTRDIAEHFDWVHSVDRLKIARRLSEQRPDSLPPLNICVQVNISGESSKSGIAPEDCEAFCEAVAHLPRLKLRGLMAIPAPTESLAQQRAVYRPLAEIMQHLAQQHESMDTLSIGMSDDHEAAIAEGGTMIRLGTAIFGPRPPRVPERD